MIFSIIYINNPFHNPPNKLIYQTTDLLPIQQRIGYLNQKFRQKPGNIALISSYCKKKPASKNTILTPSTQRKHYGKE